MLDFIVDEQIREALDADSLDALKRQVERMVDAARDGDELECSLRLTGDDVIQDLNREYRNKDTPTDVLAFAQQEGEGVCPPGLLGDVVISVETATRQAKGSMEDELLLLAAHGLCHLLGYDHQTDEEEAEMNAKVAELMSAAR